MFNQGKKLNRDEIWKGSVLIWKHALGYKKELLIMITFSFLMAVAQSFTPLVLGKLFDGITAMANSGAGIPWNWFTVLVVVMALAYIFDVCLDRVKRPLGEKVSTSYVSHFFRRFSSLPISFIKEEKKGAIHKTYNRAKNGLRVMIAFFAADTFVDLLKVFISLGIVFFISWVYGLIILVGLGTYLAITLIALPGIKDHTRKRNRADNQAGARIHEAVDSFTEVKHNHTEKEEVRNVDRAFLKVYQKAAIELQLFLFKTFSIRHAVLTITEITVLLAGLLLISSGASTIGLLVSVTLYARQSFSPIRKLANVVTNMSETAVTVYEAEQMLTKMEPENNSKNLKRAKNIKGDIEFKNASFYYQKKEGNVLKNISIKIAQDSRVAFVGRSGSGKSTAIDLVGGFYMPQKGTVSVDGIPTGEINLDDLRSQIAYVSQDVVLFADTIENNIRYGSPKASKSQIRAAAEMAYCDEFIDKLPKGYKSKIGERGVKLSGGQKQRISIARAILRDPKILILDEPTSALDIESERFISESLEKLMKGRTTIIIAHRLSTVRSAEKIFVFEDGEIVESGSHKELLEKKKGKYKKMHEMYLK